MIITPLQMAVRDGMELLENAAAFEGARWYRAPDTRACLSKSIMAGSLQGARIAWLDMMTASATFVIFHLKLFQGTSEIGRRQFSPLNWCQTRIVLDIANMDAARADRVELIVVRKPHPGADFCLGPINFCHEPPPRLETPALPRGALADEIGQSILHEWPDKTAGAEAVVSRLTKRAERRPWPASYSRWGGWSERRIAPSGFFRTHHDGRRWWLVDPDGFLFWSSGADCVHSSIDHETRYQTRWMNLTGALAWLPDQNGIYAGAFGRNPWHDKDDREFNFLAANFIRAFGPANWLAQWRAAALAEMRDIGFNTMGDWSDEELGRAAAFPYTRPLELKLHYTATPMIAGKFPDVFAPGLPDDAARYAEQLRTTVGDPAMIGYFLHNEPPWWFADGFTSPAEMMLKTGAQGWSRKAFAVFLRERYPAAAAFHCAWGSKGSLELIDNGRWEFPLTDEARRDLDDFSTIMVQRLMDALSKACRQVDPDHLNLGVRWWTFPPRWVLAAMRSVDVISFNYYKPQVGRVHYGRTEPEPGIDALCDELRKPFLVGEWHFGSFDGGLPAAGLYAVRDQAERGKAFQRYIEQAAALPWCVGAHWFNLYDRNILYNYQASENYSTGFLDITHRRHEPICRSARACHEQLYDIASGRRQACEPDVKYVFPSC